MGFFQYFKQFQNGVMARFVASHTKTVQPHDSTSVEADGYQHSDWFECEGFAELSVSMQNGDGSHSSSFDIGWSHDGSNEHGKEVNVKDNLSTSKAASVSTKAKYFRVTVKNGDADASHTLSAWAYLKSQS